MSSRNSEGVAPLVSSRWSGAQALKGERNDRAFRTGRLIPLLEQPALPVELPTPACGPMR